MSTRNSNAYSVDLLKHQPNNSGSGINHTHRLSGSVSPLKHLADTSAARVARGNDRPRL